MSEKFKFYRESIESAKEAAKTIIPEEIKSWEGLNQSINQLAQEKKTPEFKEKILETWQEFAVSGVLQFDKKEDQLVLKTFTDLDGRCALGVLKEAGINPADLSYVKPGEYLKGAVNLDTGDKFGVVYEEPTYTLYFDHHAPGTKAVTSTAEIVYKTMIGLRLLEKSESMDRLIDFVTKIDNRQFKPEEFLRSAKTILGLQRDLDFNKLLAYFQDHQSPTEELTPEEFEKYGLKEVAEKQQRVVDEAMATLDKMEKEGKVVDTAYGKIVVNVNNELKVGASAAYVKHDGIINFTPEKSFAVTHKEKDFNEEELKQNLGDKFQGKIIRGKMWIYNEKEDLKIGLKEILGVLGAPLEQKGEEAAPKVMEHDLDIKGGRDDSPLSGYVRLDSVRSSTGHSLYCLDLKEKSFNLEEMKEFLLSRQDQHRHHPLLNSINDVTVFEIQNNNLFIKTPNPGWWIGKKGWRIKALEECLSAGRIKVIERKIQCINRGKVDDDELWERLEKLAVKEGISSEQIRGWYQPLVWVEESKELSSIMEEVKRQKDEAHKKEFPEEEITSELKKMNLHIPEFEVKYLLRHDPEMIDKLKKLAGQIPDQEKDCRIDTSKSTSHVEVYVKEETPPPAVDGWELWWPKGEDKWVLIPVGQEPKSWFERPE
ncbi:MAG: hypothetical protein COT24_02040 [Candidatus Kerfeldbacteria bacterium CG08_land_8_20_14_0_20_40_16]|uniref:Uncharacterized protein n=1 Tax=Candidatus Kerfeldbacteria bacterium CG08_land_8_20_14_0_20_40_16 TaxID=2014244 RepID=A0A2H0YW38_9BACT|nr:MAG: hypothetical protein COT24_02040 [Candidatus Kerfeldbacteria bacterium CG08_land_8_20_14_0_20_40_16]